MHRMYSTRIFVDRFGKGWKFVNPLEAEEGQLDASELMMYCVDVPRAETSYTDVLEWYGTYIDGRPQLSLRPE